MNHTAVISDGTHPSRRAQQAHDPAGHRTPSIGVWKGVRTTSDPTLRSDADLVRSIYPDLHRLAAVVAPPERDPRDLVQDALERALRRGRISDLDAPLAYLRRTIVNLASNERRALGRFRRAAPRLATVDTATTAEYPSDVAELLALDPLDRTALWLTDVEGHPAATVAEILGCRPDAARARVSRARRKLRTLVEQEDER
ncbi:MAG: sigma-70 family RNA polymerase sigma factor [Actinobacteria bacterium]|nr:sigma-70 family RNA polymerase sigma factor [Actinomycetota bacterium]